MGRSNGHRRTVATYDTGSYKFFKVVPLDKTTRNVVDTLTRGFVSIGVWSSMKAIYPFVGGTSETHKYNLIDPRDADDAFRLTYTGSVTHNSDGITGDGATSMINTHINPTNDLITNDVSAHICIRTAGVDTQMEFAAEASYPTRWNFGASIGGNLESDLYKDGTSRVGFANSLTDAIGMWSITRESSVLHKVFKNGTQAGTTNTVTATTPPNNDMWLMAYENGSPSPEHYSSRNYSYYAFGDSLTETQVSDYYNVVNTFQISLGR